MKYIEQRNLVKVRVIWNGNNAFNLNTHNRSIQFFGTIDEFKKFLYGLKAADPSLPKSIRQIPYSEIVNNIIKGTENIIFIWSNLLNKTPNIVKGESEKIKEKNNKLKEESKIQSVLFDRNKFTLEKAKEWLKSHDFKTSDLDTTEDKYRFRQITPNFKRYRTEEIKNGIQFIYGFN